MGVPFACASFDGGPLETIARYPCGFCVVVYTRAIQVPMPPQRVKLIGSAAFVAQKTGSFLQRAMKKVSQFALTDRVQMVFLTMQFLGGNAASVRGAEANRLTAPFFFIRWYLPSGRQKKNRTANSPAKRVGSLEVRQQGPAPEAQG